MPEREGLFASVWNFFKNYKCQKGSMGKWIGTGDIPSSAVGNYGSFCVINEVFGNH